MEQNTFLLPDSWSELFMMNTRTAHYKTYVGVRGNDRYIDIEYIDGSEVYNRKQESRYTIEFRREHIYLQKRLGDTKNEVDTVLDIVTAIYKEKVSFEIMDEEAFKKREKMQSLNATIKSATEEFAKLKKELSDKPKKK